MKKQRVLGLALSAIMVGSAVAMTACGGGSSSEVKFWAYGDSTEMDVYKAMTDKFNETYGAENGIKVNFIPQTVSGYNDAVQLNATSSKDCPDVFVVDDARFKKWVEAGIIASDMDAHFSAVTDIDYSKTYKTAVDRMRYNKETDTSKVTDPLLGLPLDSKAAAMYYNEDLLEKAGIIVISVDAEDMDEFNKGDFKDKRGITLNEYKAKYSKLNDLEGDIPAKGYFRSMFPYTQASGEAYTPIDTDEIVIFNNRIAMNWDEVEDLAMEFTPAYNAADATKYGSDYGYFTECWFPYGWSVGGDCLQDLSGNGDWDFSLMDTSANYIVAEGQTYTGHYTGTVYQAGETLGFTDKFNVPKGAIMTADGNGGYTYQGKAVEIHQDVLTAAESGALQELPSMKEAFLRYLRLGTKTTADIEGSGGYALSPNPNIFTNRTALNYFCSGEIALLIEYSQNIPYINEYGFDWDVAPLPVYKEYKTDDPYEDEILVEGKVAGHSNLKAMVSCVASEKKDKAAKFMAWMAGEEGSKVRAEKGAFPNQSDLIDQVRFEGGAPSNVCVFAEMMEYEKPGDWWYLSNDAWILQWANDLNTYVRNDDAKMSYNAWKNGLVNKINAYLKENY